MGKYVILKNWHYSLHFPAIKKSCILKEKLRFTDSCKYDLRTVDQLDWNKLIGVTFGIKHPNKLASTIHYNSLRIGWRYNVEKDSFELVMYCYINGKRLINNQNTIFIKANEDILVEFYPLLKDNKIKVVVNSQILGYYDLPKNYNIWKRWGWKLKPYFGGNESAPHKIIIEKAK